jgi:hypothetical protein
MGRNSIFREIIMNNINADLMLLEELSKQMSDLIYYNDFKKIIELDTHRQTIIKNINKNNTTDTLLKDKLTNLINNNDSMIAISESKLKNLSKEHNKFNKIFSAYHNYK